MLARVLVCIFVIKRTPLQHGRDAALSAHFFPARFTNCCWRPATSSSWAVVKSYRSGPSRFRRPIRFHTPGTYSTEICSLEAAKRRSPSKQTLRLSGARLYSVHNPSAVSSVRKLARNYAALLEQMPLVHRSTRPVMFVGQLRQTPLAPGRGSLIASFEIKGRLSKQSCALCGSELLWRRSKRGDPSIWGPAVVTGERYFE